MSYYRLFFALCIATIISGCLFGGEGPDDVTNNDDQTNSSNSTSTANSGTEDAALNDDGRGESGLARCAGSYTGTFSGADEGLVAGELDTEGTLTVTYTSSLGVVNSAVSVTEGGEISGSEANTSITGTLDFSTCSMKGEWTTTGVGSGIWKAQKL